MLSNTKMNQPQTAEDSKTAIAEEISLHPRFLIFRGHRFHYVWLRDNCLSPKCRHPTSFQKLYDISSAPNPPEPLSADVRDGELKIVWKEEPEHESTFSIPWLLAHAYDGSSEPRSTPETLLWDSATLAHSSPQWYDAKSSTFEDWSSTLFKLGFALLRNMAFEELKPFLSSIGPLFEMEYGAIATVKAKSGANDLGNTGYALSPHTDYPNRDYPRLLVCFYMVENSVVGGETVLVDGFRIARDFRHEHPEHFRILAETKIDFRQFYRKFQYYYRQKRPILELNPAGELLRVNFAHSHSYNWDLPFEQMEVFYEAYSAFFRYLKNPTYHYNFPLQPGDCLLMDNSRILHGRAAFEPDSGIRHLEVAYIVWDYLTGRNNFYQSENLYQNRESME